MPTALLEAEPQEGTKMETTWDMSPAKRKMFIVAASFLVVRARAWNLISSLAVFFFALPAGER